MNFHFLSVNRGRYLCREHGSFCDSSDGYLQSCPLCSDQSSGVWEQNRVDRALQILGNIQARSQRSLAVATGLLGVVGLAGVLDKFAGLEATAQLDSFVPALLVGFCALLASVLFFMLSMKHMDVTLNGRFRSLEIDQWEAQISGFIGQVERHHSIATFFLGAAIMVIAAGLLAPPLWKELIAFASWICGLK